MPDNKDQLSLFEQQGSESHDFFTCKRTWSAAKHRIILRYIQAHCYNLGGDQSFQSRFINYVDGFAGEGKYDKGLGIEDFVEQSKLWKRSNVDLLDTDGSPLIALKLAKMFALEERVSLRCFFAEAKPEINQKLRLNCEVVGQGLDYKIYEPKTFSRTLPNIMADLGGYPTIFFLDAFGVKGLDFEQICSIGDYVSKYKGELFFLFHNRSIARNAGYLTQNSESEKMKQSAETYMQNLTSLLGKGSDQDWKPKWLESKGQPQQFERWALEYFVNRISRESKFNGTASFEIKEKYNDPRPQYSIVVCSNHPRKAFGEFLNESFADENKSLFYEVDRNRFVRNFLNQKWEKQNEQRKVEIKPRVIEILKRENQHWSVLKDVITTVILQLVRLGFDLGYLKRPHYREIMLELFNEGILEAQRLGRKNVPTLESLVRIVR